MIIEQSLDIMSLLCELNPTVMTPERLKQCFEITKLFLNHKEKLIGCLSYTLFVKLFELVNLSKGVEVFLLVIMNDL